MTEKERSAIASTQELLDAVSALLESTTRDGNTALLGSTVAHVGALLRSLIAIAEAGETVASGLLVRAAWESWVLGQYLAFGGQAAIEAVRSHYDRQAALIKTHEGDRTDRTSQTASGRVGKQLRIEQMYNDVVRLRTSAGRPLAITNEYDTVYRLTSTLEAHAGWPVLMRYQRKPSVADGLGIIAAGREEPAMQGADIEQISSWLSQLAFEWSTRTGARLDKLNRWTQDELARRTAEPPV